MARSAKKVPPGKTGEPLQAQARGDPGAFSSFFSDQPDHRIFLRTQRQLGHLIRLSPRVRQTQDLLGRLSSPALSPPVQAPPVSSRADGIAQMLKEPQLKDLARAIHEMEPFTSLLRALADPLELGLASYSSEKVAQLPTALEQVKTPIRVIRALVDQAREDPEIPLSEGHILSFAAHTMAYALRPLLAEAEGLAAQFGSNAEEKQKAYTALTRLCQQASEVLRRELRSLESLYAKAAPQRLPPNKTRRISLGEIHFGAPFYTGSEALGILRNEFGIVQVAGEGLTVLNVKQGAAVVNGLLTVVRTYKDYIGLEATVILPIPGDGGPRPFGVRYIIDQAGHCLVKAEPLPAPVQEDRYASVPQAKDALTHRYGIKAFTESGAAWTLKELVEVEDAFAKVGGADRASLRGLTLARIAAGGHDSQETREGGSYNPVTHVLTLTSSAFAQNLVTFVSSGGRHASAMTILHEVGHVVEFAAWREQDQALKQEALRIKEEAAALEARYDELVKKHDQVRSEKSMAEESFIKEKYDLLEDLARQADAIQAKIVQSKQLVFGQHKAGVTAYQEAFKAIPESGPSSLMDVLNPYLNGLGKASKALSAFRDNPTAAGLLEPISQALAEATAAQEAYAKNGETAALAYTPSLLQALAAFRQAYAYCKALPDLHQNALALKARSAEAEKVYAEKELKLEASFAPALAGLDRERSQTLDNLRVSRERSSKISSAQHEASIFNVKQTPRLQKFMKFVTANDIHPISRYALVELHKGNASEFFAESYHLFLNDPGFLNRASPKLFDYFNSGAYLG